tara:strand:- start:198 stop:494 length:297 start_codon:yes stop_codon:yes gene_type:complete
MPGMRLLRNYIRALIREAHDDGSTDSEDKDEKLLVEPDENKDRDDIPTDEFSTVGGIAGYTLPLGASNHPTSLRQRGETAGQGFGGARPIKKKKKARK